MVTAKTVKGLAERLAKAEQLVAEGAVFPVAGLAGYAVVRNGDGSQFYMVEYAAGHERCTCPDFQQRQRAAGLPCKHILAAGLALGGNPQPTPPAVESTPAATSDTDRVLRLFMAPRRPAA
jgi:hypothetical protein